MTHRPSCLACSVLLLALPLAAACDQGQTPIGGFDDDACESASTTTPDYVDPPDLAIAVDCVFTFGGASQVVSFETNVEYEPRVVGGDLDMTATLFDDQFEGRSFQISLYTLDGTVSTSVVYQIRPEERPANQFLGDHGFTGLHAVRDPASEESVQWICAARDPSDPVHVWQD